MCLRWPLGAPAGFTTKARLYRPEIATFSPSTNPASQTAPKIPQGGVCSMQWSLPSCRGGPRSHPCTVISSCKYSPNTLFFCQELGPNEPFPPFLVSCCEVVGTRRGIFFFFFNVNEFCCFFCFVFLHFPF